MIEDSVVVRLRWILVVNYKKCLFKIVFGLSSKKYQRSALLAPYELLVDSTHKGLVT